MIPADSELAAYLERLPVGVYRTARDGRILLANTALARIFGFDNVEELLDLHIPDLYVNAEERKRAFTEADAGKHEGVREHLMLRRDGTQFWARMHSRPLRDDQGKTVIMEGVLHDITEERALRERLVVSEGRFRTAFEQSPFPMLLVDPEMNFMAANRAVGEMLGATEAELIEGGGPALMSEEDWADAQLRVGALRRGESDGYTVTRRFQFRNGPEKWVIVSVGAVRSPDGSLNSFITQFVDITDQQRILDELEALVTSKEDLVRSVSHELRTPLTTIVGLTAELTSKWEEFPEDERRELVQLVSSQGADMAELIDDLLAAAQSETVLFSIEPESLDLVAEVRAIARFWEPRARLTLLLPAEPLVCHADPYRVRQILRNLLSNALKYGTEPITMQANLEDGTACVSVRDAGQPLPESQREAIFDPYYRATTSQIPPGSVGLGLAVSRNLARIMGGDLIYRETDGQSDFVLSLPLAPGS
ncbi:MAG: PAS domain S-box protein [Acidimicrobiia bacterium]